MDEVSFAHLVIHSTVCHLEKLSRKHGGIGGIDLFVLKFDDHILSEVIVHGLFRGTHEDRHFVDNAFRHIQVVHALHGDGDVGYFVIYRILRSGERFVAEHHLCVAFVRLEVRKTVAGYVPSKPFSEIKDSELRP